MKTTAVLGLALTCAAGAVGCTAIRGPIGERRDVAPVRGGTMRLAIYADVRDLEPARAFDIAAQAIEQLLFDRLVDYDRDGNLIPLLAERLAAAADGKSYSFKLHEGVLFHDGEELTADDVKRSIERALHPDTPCPAPSFYRSIVGYEEFHNGRKGDDGKLAYAPHLSGVAVDGRYLVRIDLTEPDATFLPALTLFFLAPVCKSAGATYSPDWSNRACGTGPFRLGHWQASREIELLRHEGYFQPGEPYLDRVRFYMLMPSLTQRFKFEEGELDHIRELSFPDSLAYRRDPRWHPFGQWQPARMTIGIFLNTQMTPFDNVELRRAFASGVDWQQIAALRPGELVTTTQMTPPAVPGHDPTFPGQKYDPAEALVHMKKAGYPYDPATRTGGYPYPVRFVANVESLPSDTIAPLAAQQLARIGIRMDIRSVSWPTFLAETGKRNTVALGYGNWVMDFPDPSDFFEPTLSSEAIQDEETRNAAFYSNPEFDRLLAEAHREIDPGRRAALYHRCEAIVRDDAPWSLGLNQRYYELVQPYVHGYFVDKTHSIDVRRVWLDLPERGHGALSRRVERALALVRPWGKR